MAKNKTGTERVGKGDGLYYCCIEFSQINFNYYFSATLDTKTTPSSYLYLATPGKDGASIGESYITINTTRYYSHTKIPPTTISTLPLIKLQDGDYVRVLGNVAHIYTKEPVFAMYIGVPTN